jgi:hypothetical protein
MQKGLMGESLNFSNSVFFDSLKSQHQVLGYYAGEEDAYDLRKAMRRDVHKESTVPLLHPITPDELEW